MSELVRCRACGYIMKQRSLGQVCPACGLPKTAFEPYKEKLSPGRSLILNLDLHPMLVHFPQAFCSILPLLVIAGILFPTFYAEQLVAVASFTAVVLPLTVVGALLSGLIDAKTKLKKLGTPALVRKIVVGSTLLLVSAANALVVVLSGFRPGTRICVLLLSMASLVCAMLLGMMGKKLIQVVLPG